MKIPALACAWKPARSSCKRMTPIRIWNSTESTFWNLSSRRTQQQRKKLAFHLLALGNGRNAGQRRFVGVGSGAIEEGIDDDSPAGAIGAVLKRAVDHQ